MARTRTHDLWWLLIVVVTFFVLNSYSLHTGDDMGYMFSDTTHHCGDGVRVTSLGQCFSTQMHHYVTTNGRFAVHVVVMALLNLMPLWVYRLLNSLMFGMLWYLSTRFVADDKRTDTHYGVAWLLLMVALPQPGLVLLTLVSYAVNYLWVGVAVLALLLWLQRNAQSRLLIVYALFVGTLQESFSLPVCAGLVMATIFKRVPWQVTCAFIVGTAIEVFAPGNMAHAAQGGGFTLESICRKLEALGSDLCYSIVSYAVVGGMVWLCLQRKACVTFVRENVLIVVAILAALGLAALTFTSPRQLTAPSLLTIILILKLIPSRQWLTNVSIAATVAVMVPMGYYKYEIHERYNTFIKSVNLNRLEANPSGHAPCTTNNFVTRSFIPDPLCNRGLVAVGDKYTKKGLERLRFESSSDARPLRTILPVAPEEIVSGLDGHDYVTQRGDTIIIKTETIEGFSMTVVERGMPYSHKLIPHTAFEEWNDGNITYLVLTANTPELKLIRKNKAKE